MLFEQMQEEPDYGENAKPDLICYFYEAVGRTPLKNFVVRLAYCAF